MGKRSAPDRSQTLRRIFQTAFLALNAWIGVQFYLFVRHYENDGQGPAPSRPPGVEGWLPIASLMNLKVLLATGELPRIHPAGVILLIAFVAMSWVARKSFCSWLCPVGTVSDYLGRFGRRLFRRNFRFPRWLDIGLRTIKYVLFGLFLYVVASMSVEGIRQFLGGPFGLLDDVKLLNFFRTLTSTGIVVIVILVLASILVENFWCRYLCPYGAFLGVVGLAGPLRIRREPSLCIDCDKCTKACPSRLPVAQLITIRSAECTSCMQCVASCPAAGALAMAAPGRRPVAPWAIAAIAGFLFLGSYGYAHWTGHWRTDLPDHVYRELIPRANEFEH